MNNIPKEIAKFITSPFSYVYDYSNQSESFLKSSLYLASTFMSLIIIYTSVVNVFSSDREGFYSSKAYFTMKELQVTNNKVSSMKGVLQSLIVRLKSVEDNIENQSYLLKNFSKVSKSLFSVKTPVRFFIHVKVFDIFEDFSSYKSNVKFGLSWSVYRENTQVPVVSFSKGSFTGSLVFDSMKSLWFLVKNKGFFEKHNISFNQNEEEILSVNLSTASSLLPRRPSFKGVISPPPLMNSESSGKNSISDVPPLKSVLLNSMYLRIDFTNFIFLKLS